MEQTDTKRGKMDVQALCSVQLRFSVDLNMSSEDLFF